MGGEKGPRKGLANETEKLGNELATHSLGIMEDLKVW